ncbi:MAG: beta-galactosidase [Candidatus Sumerlaeota bacterium]|nr:beta-galactosidase [Candidatus Sumerlaeota bacterium]
MREVLTSGVGLFLWLAASLAPAAEALFAAAGAEVVHLKAVAVEALPSGRNLLSNPGFEEPSPKGVPSGWQWDKRNTDATCAIDRGVAHSGQCSIKLTNGTARGAHIYGMLWRAQALSLIEGKSYTMSAWVKADASGSVQMIGGADWQIRVHVPDTDGQWRRVSGTFKAGVKDNAFVLRINVEGPTRGVWIDDVKIEEGTAATPDPPDSGANAKPTLDANEAETLIQGDGPFSLAFTLANPRATAGTFSAALSSGESVRQPIALAAGIWRVLVKGDAASANDAPRKITLRLEDAGKEIATAGAQVRFCSAANALKRLAALKAGLPALQRDLQAVRTRGQDVSYPLVAATILENFIGYAEEDARRREVKRSLDQVGDMEEMSARLGRELKEALAGQRQFAAVPRWTGDKRPIIKSSSFLAPVRMPGSALNAAPIERPVFFNGYGHFGRVVSDMEKWPSYGVNIIQIEVGPRRIFPADGRTDEAPVRETLQTLDRAQKAGVAVCLLISPHYMPEWAVVKWPQLRKRREGFLKYCLHAPEGQELLRRFISVLITPMKNHPALHSICLSNEPVNVEEPCEPAKQMWRGWLEKRHGDIARLNSRYGAKYASFAEVPLPDPFAAHPAPPVWMDYIRFNQEFFAGWHKMMADAIRAAAPGLPVHAKAMTWTMTNDIDIKYGVDAFLFGQFSDINGNDAVNNYDFSEGGAGQSWQMNAMGHDLQCSVLDAPVFNTENHLIADRDTRYVPAIHIRAALWQAAIHGQSATAIWVWERTFDAKSDFAGSIMHRPACAEAVGVVNHDLNRAALEVTAIQQARPQALLLQSFTASVWDVGRYSDCMGKLYSALSFTGLKLGFITERQLESGVVPDAPVVFVPDITHFSDAALAGLRKYKGHLVFVGEGDLLNRDEYGKARNPDLRAEKIPFRYGPTSSRELWTHILAKAPAWNLRPAVELRGPDRQPVWGVEWRSAETSGGLVVNLCNYSNAPASVTIIRGGAPAPARDALSGKAVETPLTLAPLEIRLLRLTPEIKSEK